MNIKNLKIIWDLIYTYMYILDYFYKKNSWNRVKKNEGYEGNLQCNIVFVVSDYITTVFDVKESLMGIRVVGKGSWKEQEVG